MRQRKFSLTSLLLLMGALPIWSALIFMVSTSPAGYGPDPERFVIGPIVLGGVTWALHRLIRDWRDAWAISSLLAAIICFGTLMVVSCISLLRID